MHGDQQLVLGRTGQQSMRAFKDAHWSRSRDDVLVPDCADIREFTNTILQHGGQEIVPRGLHFARYRSEGSEPDINCISHDGFY